MGVLFEGGGLIEGVINFAPEGRNCCHFYLKVMPLMLFNGEIFPLLVIKIVDFHWSSVKFVIIQN